MIALKKNSFLKRFCFIFLLLIGGITIAFAQEKESGYEFGKIGLSKSISISSKYTFDPVSGMYMFSETIDGYPINAPMVMTPKEFEALVRANEKIFPQ